MGRRSRYEREIEEILRRLEPPPPRRPLRQRLFSALTTLRQALRTFRLEFSPQSLMLLSLALAISTYPLRAIWPPLVLPVTLASLGLFLLALVAAAGARRRPFRPGWRGRPLDLSAGRPSLWQRLLFWRRRHHNRYPRL